MSAESARSFLLDTNVLIHRRHLSPDSLTGNLSISAVSLAELSAGVHLVTGDDAESVMERARRIEVLQRTEHEFDPIPFGMQAARMYGRIHAAGVASGRHPRRRIADLLIAATAASEGIGLYTMNPADFAGLDDFLTVVPVPRPNG